MARIVLGMGTSHAPQLSMDTSFWPGRAAADRRNPELWFQGKAYAFPDLVEVRSGEGIEKELSPEKAEARFAACQRDIAGLSEVYQRVRPDVAILIGDDQHESFLDDNMPAFSVYWGDTVDNAAYHHSEQREKLGLAAADRGHMPQERATYPIESDLGHHIITSLVEDGFDPGHSRRLPPGREGHGGIGHAFGFVYRRIMNDEVIPNVPIFLNTYYPPNQPTMRRSYQLGMALRRAVESWDQDKTVAIVASGGLSHFVIEEELDQEIIRGMLEKDQALLTSFPESYFNSGTSEIRNWVVVAGAMAESDLDFKLLDYVPCYRSEAGTGCAMTFATWER